MSYCKWRYLDGLGHSGLGNVADLVESLRRPLPAHVAMPLCTCTPAYVRPALSQSIGLGRLGEVSSPLSPTTAVVGVIVVGAAAIGFFAWLEHLAR